MLADARPSHQSRASPEAAHRGGLDICREAERANATIKAATAPAVARIPIATPPLSLWTMLIASKAQDGFDNQSPLPLHPVDRRRHDDALSTRIDRSRASTVSRCAAELALRVGACAESQAQRLHQLAGGLVSLISWFAMAGHSTVVALELLAHELAQLLFNWFLKAGAQEHDGSRALAFVIHCSRGLVAVGQTCDAKNPPPKGRKGCPNGGTIPGEMPLNGTQAMTRRQRHRALIAHVIRYVAARPTSVITATGQLKQPFRHGSSSRHACQRAPWSDVEFSPDLVAVIFDNAEPRRLNTAHMPRLSVMVDVDTPSSSASWAMVSDLAPTHTRQLNTPAARLT